MSVPFIEIAPRDSFLLLVNGTNTAFEGLTDSYNMFLTPSGNDVHGTNSVTNYAIKISSDNM